MGLTDSVEESEIAAIGPSPREAASREVGVMKVNGSQVAVTSLENDPGTNQVVLVLPAGKKGSDAMESAFTQALGQIYTTSSGKPGPDVKVYPK